jgi:hypothetical protein
MLSKLVPAATNTQVTIEVFLGCNDRNGGGLLDLPRG